MSPPDRAPPRLLLPDVPAVVAGTRRTLFLSPDGELEELDPAAARRRLSGIAPLVCHARSLARRLELPGLRCHDVLELFAFVRPAQFAVPTARGLAERLELDCPPGRAGEALALARIAATLLGELARSADAEAATIGNAMAAAGWPWGAYVQAALQGVAPSARGFAAWRGLPEISEHAPPPPAGHEAVEQDDARRRLADLLGAQAEPRPSQADYAASLTPAFAPRNRADHPNVVLAEAGTGVGKTLGYLAPASLWAEKNEGPVWVSTYTRNLQHQIDGELDRLFPTREVKALKAVLRKGRENYLCLLNLEEAVQALPSQPGNAIALGLMARWTAATRDGDLTGGDFPGWLPELVGRQRTLGLSDRRGECVYAACPHYHRCFIERSIRRAKRADLVIANHALVMVQAALGGDDDTVLPTRLVFDEGHHVFDAADSAFSAHLSAAEGEELRRWLLGAEAGRASRARGLKRRIEDLVGGDDAAVAALGQALEAARELPGDGWHVRLPEARPHGAVERFLDKARAQVYARTTRHQDVYGLETELHPPIDGLVEAGGAAAGALRRLRTPLERLRKRVLDRLETEAADLDSTTRLRIEAIARSLNRRALVPLAGWIAMLDALATTTPPEFVDWLQIERIDGRDLDIGMYRHWIDPTQPFARAVIEPAHGVVITSATLTDGTGDEAADWAAAEARNGMSHLAVAATRARAPSPFNYPDQTRVFIVTDVRKDDLAQVASAYRALFLAAEGGALGLFTAISRLRAVHARIAPVLDEAGLKLLAQHVDPIETASLIDIFRAEEDACLLGTDAVRDGVDVPGRSLRLIVFDRVPWPRPTILHRARRKASGGKGYDDMLTRLKLKQAFGRLVRRADDVGVFVLLDPMMPSRLLGAFPPGVPVARVGLAEAVAGTRAFLHPEAPPVGS
ncbi:MAG: ATP-dependent DNA helicase [Pseudomonadota bacterium]